MVGGESGPRQPCCLIKDAQLPTPRVWSPCVHSWEPPAELLGKLSVTAERLISGHRQGFPSFQCLRSWISKPCFTQERGGRRGWGVE